MKQEVDVLIVGGGPAGLATAHSLGGCGRVMLIHQDNYIGLPVRTSGGSWKRDIDALGIPRHLYHEIRRLSLWSPVERATIAFGADMPVVLDVTGTYQYLADLAKCAGAVIYCNTFFERITAISASRVTCLVSCGTQQFEISAKFVVDASGYRRVVLSSTGSSTISRRVGVGVEYEFENHSDDRDTAVLFFGERYTPSGYGWVFPTRIDTIRIGIGLIRPDTSASPGKALDAFLSSGVLSRRGINTGALLARHSGVIPSDGPASDFIYHRILAVGDFVSQALPLVGEGIRYSVEAGRHVGAAVAKAVHDEAHYNDHLGVYSAWWNTTYRRRFSIAQKMNVKMGCLKDRHWDALVDFCKLLSGNEIAMLLRAEFTAAGVSRLLLKHGRRTLRLLLRHPASVLRHCVRFAAK